MACIMTMFCTMNTIFPCIPSMAAKGWACHHYHHHPMLPQPPPLFHPNDFHTIQLVPLIVPDRPSEALAIRLVEGLSFTHSPLCCYHVHRAVGFTHEDGSQWRFLDARCQGVKRGNCRMVRHGCGVCVCSVQNGINETKYRHGIHVCQPS